MGALNAFARYAAAALMLIVASPTQAQSVADWRPEVTEGSIRFGIPITWIEHVMQAESRGRMSWHGRPTRSRAGAMGLMQLMPTTWAEMRARYRLGADPYDPHDNIIAGTAYLRLMYDRFGYPGLFAAYNVGPGRYDEYLNGRALPSETRAYLLQVAGQVEPAVPQARPRPSERLFAAVGNGDEPSAALRAAAEPDHLFALPPRP